MAEAIEDDNDKDSLSLAEQLEHLQRICDVTTEAPTATPPGDQAPHNLLCDKIIFEMENKGVYGSLQ